MMWWRRRLRLKLFVIGVVLFVGGASVAYDTQGTWDGVTGPAPNPWTFAIGMACFVAGTLLGAGVILVVIGSGIRRLVTAPERRAMQARERENAARLWALRAGPQQIMDDAELQAWRASQIAQLSMKPKRRSRG